MKTDPTAVDSGEEAPTIEHLGDPGRRPRLAGSDVRQPGANGRREENWSPSRGEKIRTIEMRTIRCMLEDGPVHFPLLYETKMHNV